MNQNVLFMKKICAVCPNVFLGDQTIYKHVRTHRITVYYVDIADTVLITLSEPFLTVT